MLTSAAADAQVVQLPTFSFFTVQTSVVVPDSGGAYLGGVSGSRASRQRFHLPLLPGQSAVGRSQSAHGVGVAATIHDFAELDRRWLATASAAQQSAGAVDPFTRRLAAAASDDLPRGLSVRAGEKREVDREAQRFLDLGNRAMSDGKTDVARLYYQMAARRAPAELAREISTRIAELEQASSPARRPTDWRASGR